MDRSGRGRGDPVTDAHAPASDTAPDPFDPASLRLSAAGPAVGVKKVLRTVPVRKPEKTWFVRVHPDPEYALEALVLQVKEEREETFLVAPGLREALAGEPAVRAKALFTAVNRQGVVFVWPVNLPDAEGKHDDWSRTAADAAELARSSWVRVTARMSLGAYEMHVATGDIPEPEWPDLPLRGILEIAFRGRYIDTVDHPVLRRLRGEI